MKKPSAAQVMPSFLGVHSQLYSIIPYVGLDILLLKIWGKNSLTSTPHPDIFLPREMI